MLVFAAWRVPGLQSTMIKWFTSNPAGNATCLPMNSTNTMSTAMIRLSCKVSVLLTALSCFTSSAGAEGSPIHTKLSGTYISKVFKRPPPLTPNLGLSSRHCGDLGSLCCGDMWVCEDSQGADTGSSLPPPGQRQAEPVLTRLANLRFSCCSGTPIIAVAQFL